MDGGAAGRRGRLGLESRLTPNGAVPQPPRLGQLHTPAGAPVRFVVEIDSHPADGAARAFAVTGPDRSGATVTRRYALKAAQHPDYLDLFEGLAADFGTHLPFSRQAVAPPPGDAPFAPLLTAPVAPEILYGYGDPCVIREVGADGRPVWYLVVTSNDAPDAFPILRSDDLADWRLTGFVFPRGTTPAWTLTGENLADFWAPEIHRVGEAFWVCFTARQLDRSLAIGIAVAGSPEGPFLAHDEPLLTGGVIDPHILIAPDGAPHLIWKPDNNHLWPALLAEALHKRPDLIGELFAAPEDQRTACLVVALWPWVSTLAPMEQFFLQQPLIEAATADFGAFRGRLRRFAAGTDPLLRIQAEAILAALVTRIYCQPLAADGRSLIGAPRPLLENDQDWEAHLIEGVWTVEHAGRYYLFYSGNDFSTPHYGIGAAVADAPQGPYHKLDRPLLRSTEAWWGPGHPSVALGPDGRHRMFLHAFFPGRAGYKAFRALLTSLVEFRGDEIRLSRP